MIGAISLVIHTNETLVHFSPCFQIYCSRHLHRPLYRLDYCTSLSYNLHTSQIAHLQQIQKSCTCCCKRSKILSHHFLDSLYWLKITEHIEYKLLSVTYTVRIAIEPSYLHNLVVSRSTGRSSYPVTLVRALCIISLWITNPSFRYTPPVHLVSGINCLLLSVNLLQDALSLTHLILRVSDIFPWTFTLPDIPPLP